MIETELILRFMEVFINRTDAFYVQVVEGEQFRYQARHEELTIEHIRHHLSGHITIGAPALSIADTCKWGCFDFDTSPSEIDHVEQFLNSLNVKSVREGGRAQRDGHLWILLERPVAATDMRLFADEVARHCALADVEFFPKQSTQKRLSNPVRLPLGVHRKPEAGNVVGWFEPAANDLLSQLQWLSGCSRNDPSGIEAIADRLRFMQSFAFKSKEESDLEELDPAEVFADLNPEHSGDYYRATCPACKQRRAYFYAGGNVLKCNRINNCGYSISIRQWLGLQKSQQQE